ncbi:hypothetical protein BC939DRAFT_405280, partial [Gamsiella multidivaricata]|uniref:uncharacterized protein n=1 Tax=Gamsiella multidivaricata TaxID=101098 RepID=UPI002220B965
MRSHVPTRSRFSLSISLNSSIRLSLLTKRLRARSTSPLRTIYTIYIPVFSAAQHIFPGPWPIYLGPTRAHSHVAKMGIYRPLVVTALLEGCQLLECDSPVTMRMNLMASSRDDPRILYIVNGDRILVYHFSTLTPSGLPTLTKRMSDPRCANDNSDDKTINVIKTGYLGTEEVLVTADESGDVCVWFTMNLQRDPLLLSVTESAWGIAIHAEQRLIAISSNAHTVTVFHCGIDSRPSQRLFSGYTEPSASGSNASSSSGHGHNIPCVTFSPCGRFVATASVDQTCRTW